MPCGHQRLACRADVDIALLFEDEVSTRERIVLPRALVPDRDVRRDASTDDEGKELPVPWPCQRQAASASDRTAVWRARSWSWSQPPRRRSAPEWRRHRA